MLDVPFTHALPPHPGIHFLLFLTPLNALKGYLASMCSSLVYWLLVGLVNRRHWEIRHCKDNETDIYPQVPLSRDITGWLSPFIRGQTPTWLLPFLAPSAWCDKCSPSSPALGLLYWLLLVSLSPAHICVNACFL